MKPLIGLMLGLMLGAAISCSPAKSPRDVKSTSSLKTRPSRSEKDKTSSATKTADEKDSATKPKDKGPPPPNPMVSETAEEGILRGEVAWKGPRSKPAAEEHFVRRQGNKVAVKPPVPVRIDPATNGVRDVMVWLAVPPANAVKPVLGSVRLMQSHASYRPAVQFQSIGTLLRLRTTDDSADFQGRGPLRFSRFLHRGESRQIALTKPGLVTIHSANRPWMLPACIIVLDHNFHAITGVDGKFDLPKVPPGEYRVHLRHRAAGKENKPVEITVPVKVAAGKGADIRWTLRAGAAAP